jgi:hypothetical protein
MRRKIMEIKIEVGTRYLVKDLTNKIKNNGLTNQLEELIITELSPSWKYACSFTHGWFPLNLLEIVDVLEPKKEQPNGNSK